MKLAILTILFVTFAMSTSQAQFAGGSGSEDDPYQVETVEQLQEIYPDYLEKHFIQIADIDASDTENWNDGEGFYPIGDDLIAFSGTYDGQLYEISYLTINRAGQRYIALFGVLTGDLHSINLTDVTINGSRYTGGLAAESSGEIRNSSVNGLLTSNNEFFGGIVGNNHGKVVECSFVGDLSGRGWIGGLVGNQQSDNAIVKKSYSKGTVTGSWDRIGGIAGYFRGGKIINSFSNSNIEGDNEVGGAVGYSTGSALVSNTFSTGLVEGSEDVGGFIGSNGVIIENSFWDIESSGVTSGSGRGFSGDISDLTTDEMSGMSPYEIMSVFDFKDTWHLTEDYPALQWQDDVEALPLPPRKVELLEPDSAGTGLSRLPKLTWNADDRAETYRIQLSDDPDFDTLHLDETTSEAEWTVSDSLDFESTWHWRVRAVNEGDEGDWSDSWSFTTVGEPGMVALEDPANSATHVNAHPSFSWAEVDGVDHYDFQLAADSSFSTLEADFNDLTETSVQIADTLNPLTTYYWRVRSGNIGGKSEWSEPWSFTTVDLPDEPVLVSPADSSLQLDPPIGFEWTAADRADAYRIRIYANEIAPDHLVVDSLVADTTFAYSDLSHTNTYHWTVAARNSTGEGSSSQSSMFTMRVQAPLLTSPEPDQQDVPRHAQLAWEPVEDATAYLVELAQDSLFEETIARYDVTENSSIESGPLQWRMTYYWRAFAIVENDTSHASPASSFTVGGPAFTFDPQQLHFETVRTGSRVERSLSIENSGTDSLFIDDIHVPDERLSIMLPDSIDPDAQPEGHRYGLPAEDSFEAVVALDGSQPGHIDGYMVFSDGLGTLDSLRITGFIGMGELAFEPDTLSFASTRIGEMIREPVTLTNVGNDTLSIQSVTVSDGTYGANLRNFTLAPDEAIVDSIAFAPSMDPASSGHIIYRSVDDYRDTLYVESNTVPVVDQPEDRSITSGRRELTTVVSLSAGESMDPDGGELSYRWHLLNGSGEGGDPESLSEEPDFTFDAPVGTNQIRLTVTDVAGASDSADFRVDVSSFAREMESAVEAGITAYGDSADYNLFIADVSYTPGDGSRIFEVDEQLDNLFNLTVPQAIRTAASVSADSSVFITNGPNLNGFDNRGVELWPTKGLGGAAMVTPTIDTRNRSIYVGVTNNNLFAYDYQTGDNRWTYRVDAPISASAVITRDHKLIFPTEAGTLYGFDLDAISDGADAEPAWEQNFEDGVVHAPAIDSEDNIIVGTLEGNLLKLSLGAGGNIALLWDESICNSITTSPVIDGAGDVYFGCGDGELYKIDGQDGSVAWSYPSGGIIAATPAISDYGRIYFGNDEGVLTALSLEGEKAWAFHNEGAIQADVLHIFGTTYIGTMDGIVYGFFDDGGRPEQVEANKAAAKSGTADTKETAETAVQAATPQWGTYMGNNRRTGWASDRDDPTETDADSERQHIPSEFKLAQNYPNPFNPSTHIRFAIPEQSHVRLTVYNILGQQVGTLLSETRSPGWHDVIFDASGLSSGVFIYRIEAGEYVETRQMMFVK